MSSILDDIDRLTADDFSIVDKLAYEAKRAWERAEELVFERDEMKAALESMAQRVSGGDLQDCAANQTRVERDEYQRVLNEKYELIQKVSNLEIELNCAKADKADNLEMYNQHLSNVVADYSRLINSIQSKSSFCQMRLRLVFSMSWLYKLRLLY